MPSAFDPAETLWVKAYKLVNTPVGDTKYLVRAVGPSCRRRAVAVARGVDDERSRARLHRNRLGGDERGFVQRVKTPIGLSSNTVPALMPPPPMQVAANMILIAMASAVGGPTVLGLRATRSGKGIAAATSHG